MSASTPPGSEALTTLKTVVDSCLALLAQLEAGLAEIVSDKEQKVQPTLPNPTTTETPIDALSLARDSASLVRAHATKISLLIINEPFTPTAIIKVLRELIAGPIPALGSAAQLCDSRRYTKTVRRDLSWRCSQILKELRGLVERIPLDGKILTPSKKNGTAGAAAEKGSIAATGVIWAACDEVIRFTNLGVAGYLISRVEQFRETLKDVLEELKEWSEEADDDEEDVDEAHEDEMDGPTEALESAHISTQAMLDDLMSSQQHIPRDDPDKIRERLDSCLRRLRLTTLLYQAVIKRRLRKMPLLPAQAESNVAGRLDEIMPILKRMPEKFSSLALAFYDLEAAEIDRLMDQCFFDAFAASELLAKPWEDGQKDEFTEWALKFQQEIKKG